jgi:hypothetical protein
VLGGIGRRQALADDLTDAALHIARHVLRQQGHLRPRCEYQLTAIRLHLAAKNPQESRFPRSIAPQQADPLPHLDLARSLVQERRPAKPDLQILGSYERHQRGQSDNGSRAENKPIVDYC